MCHVTLCWIFLCHKWLVVCLLMCLNVLVGLQGEVCVCVCVCGGKIIILLKAVFPAEMSDSDSVVVSVQTDTESVSQLH